MRKSLQQVYDMFAGNRVFIVGGGNSLRDFDFTKLHSLHTVAINAAFIDVPDASCLYWADQQWAVDNLKRGLLTHSCKHRFCGVNNVGTALAKDTKRIGNANVLQRTGITGLDLNPDNVRGNNSGAHALNFTINMEASEIILMGIDLITINEKTHYHDRHSRGVSHNLYTEKFIPCFESMAVEIKKLDKVKVYNTSLNSALSCFEKVNIEEFL